MITKDMELFTKECLEKIKSIHSNILLSTNSPILSYIDSNQLHVINVRTVLGKWFEKYVTIIIDNNIDFYGQFNYKYNIIKLNYKKCVKDDLEKTYKCISTTILHELIHALDPKRNIRLKSYSYYNNPIEIDAYVYSTVYENEKLKDLFNSNVYKKYSKNKKIKRKLLKSFYKQKETKCH